MKLMKEIFINVTAGSTRIAIVENGILHDIYIELPEHQRMVGDIYKGRIQNVIPGMQAAFIDIGHDINAFLPFSEMGNEDNLNQFSFSDDSEDEKTVKKKQKFNPAEDLKKNDDILVQVIKEPFSGKGPRVTTDISIPGSFMVLVPNIDYIGISRKITDKYEKRRLRRIVKEFKPEGFGIIIRTISQGKNNTLLKSDFDRLWEQWNQLTNKINKKTAPALVYDDFATSDQVIRDLFTPDTNNIYIDDKKLYNRIYKYVKEINPSQLNKLQLRKSKGYIFEEHNIDDQIRKTLNKKVWLKSGGHLVIEHTEAMVVIDVNSGRFIGKKDHEQNSLKINIEAAQEVARQLKLRDIGGLIVIDFIDLQEQKNRKKVFDQLRTLLKKDRAKVSLSEFSNFGLLEMTRQRTRLSLLHTVCDECPECHGLGVVSSYDTVLTNLENWLRKFKSKNRDKRLVISLNPSVSDYIINNKSKIINGMMWANWTFISIEGDHNININDFKVFSKKQNKYVTD
tara:strand:- start:964 stop:2490 length:1527 start_codon:yes stop_codon:yes gene_type:complete